MLDIGAADVFAEWLALLLSQKQFRWEGFYDEAQKRGIACGWLDIVMAQDGDSRPTTPPQAPIPTHRGLLSPPRHG